MGVWPAGALAPGVICLPLVQSLWSVEGTCRTEATPSRAGNGGGGGWVALKGKLRSSA